MTVHVSGLDEGAPIFDEGLAPAKLLELLPGDDEAADPPEFPGGDPVATPDEDPTPLSEDICNCFSVIFLILLNVKITNLCLDIPA